MQACIPIQTSATTERQVVRFHSYHSLLVFLGVQPFCFAWGRGGGEERQGEHDTEERESERVWVSYI